MNLGGRKWSVLYQMWVVRCVLSFLRLFVYFSSSHPHWLLTTGVREDVPTLDLILLPVVRETAKKGRILREITTVVRVIVWRASQKYV